MHAGNVDAGVYADSLVRLLYAFCMSILSFANLYMLLGNACMDLEILNAVSPMQPLRRLSSRLCR
jgi:hypothetical protein